MTKEEAIERIEKLHKLATTDTNYTYVQKPVAWALYHTWLEAEHDERKKSGGR